MIDAALKPGRSARVWVDEHPEGMAFTPSGYESGAPVLATLRADQPRLAGVEIHLQTGGSSHYVCIGGTLTPGDELLRIEVGWSTLQLPPPVWCLQYGGEKYVGMSAVEARLIAATNYGADAEWVSGTLRIDHAVTAPSSATPIILHVATRVLVRLMSDRRVADNAERLATMINHELGMESRLASIPRSARATA
jgi:hypothetical protein